MKSRTLQFLIGTVFVLCASDAQAGLISPSLDDRGLFALRDATSADPTSAADVKAPTQEPDTPRKVLEAHAATTGSSGGMTGNSVNPTTHTSAVGGCDSESQIKDSLLIFMLGAEDHVWLPDGFQLGVFRPPQLFG